MKPKIRWGRLLRRSAALFLATLAVWALLLSAGGGSAGGTLRGLGENPDFVSGALALELGQPVQEDPLAALDGWGGWWWDNPPCSAPPPARWGGGRRRPQTCPPGSPPRTTTT